jgi:preprotein translocase subunit SecB
MIQAPPAEFSLDSYRIIKYAAATPENEEQPINLNFNAKGEFTNLNSSYTLTFDFAATGSEDNSDIVTATMVAFFSFKESVDVSQVPEYFYSNSLGIVFPFMRAFVSSLTMLAGGRQMILPIVNLSSLGAELKENTTINK